MRGRVGGKSQKIARPVANSSDFAARSRCLEAPWRAARRLGATDGSARRLKSGASIGRALPPANPDAGAPAPPRHTSSGKEECYLGISDPPELADAIFIPVIHYSLFGRPSGAAVSLALVCSVGVRCWFRSLCGSGSEKSRGTSNGKKTRAKYLHSPKPSYFSYLLKSPFIINPSYFIQMSSR